MMTGKKKENVNASSSINMDVVGETDYGEGVKKHLCVGFRQSFGHRVSIPVRQNVNIGEVKLAVNDYFAGCSCYSAGLPYRSQNARLLYRALLYVCHKEGILFKAFSSNPDVEISYYPDTDVYAVINNTNVKQESVIFNIEGKPTKLILKPTELRWVKGKKWFSEEER